MGAALISFLFAVSLGTWVYSKFFGRRVGEGNVKSAVIASGAIGLVAFVVLYSLLRMFTP